MSNNNVINYVPKRDTLGRFKGYVKDKFTFSTKFKVAFVIFSFIGWALVALLLRTGYVVRCGNPYSAEHKYAGALMSKQTCDDLVTAFINNSVQPINDSGFTFAK